jgi:Fur family transcriptional regulator, peroxide stress response regulator
MSRADIRLRLEDLTKMIKEKGYRLTPQRVAILRILAVSEGHPSAEQVYEQIKRDFPTTSLATVYKTITLLKAEGEILELNFGNGRSRYDGNRPQPHPHLICIKCQAIIDADVPFLIDFSQELTQKHGYKILHHRIDFFGFCSECQKRWDL